MSTGNSRVLGDTWASEATRSHRGSVPQVAVADALTQ